MNIERFEVLISKPSKYTQTTEDRLHEIIQDKFKISPDIRIQVRELGYNPTPEFMEPVHDAEGSHIA